MLYIIRGKCQTSCYLSQLNMDHSHKRRPCQFGRLATLRSNKNSTYYETRKSQKEHSGLKTEKNERKMMSASSTNLENVQGDEKKTPLQ